MAGPLISAMPDVRRRSPAALAAEEDEADLRTQRYFDDLQARTSQADEWQRRGSQTWNAQQDRFAQALWAERMRRLGDPGRSQDLEADLEAKLAQGSGADQEYFIPGVGFVSPREQRAIHALAATPPARRTEGDYEFAGNPLIEGTHGLVEGILAGLSSDTEDSQGFLPEFQKGVLGLVMPDQGVDEATRERLYGRMSPLKRMVAETVTSPVNHLWPMASMRTSAGRSVASIPTFLESASGDRIRSLLSTPATPGRRVMPLALP
jgi:hypothetical protein